MAFTVHSVCWQPWLPCRIPAHQLMSQSNGLLTLTAHTCANVNLPGVERSIAEELVRKTERICHYTRMARHGIVNFFALVVLGDVGES